MRNPLRRLAQVGAATLMSTALLVATAPGALAGTERVCNASFCNATSGTGTLVTRVVATKIGLNRGSLGFFEVFGPRGPLSTGPTTTSDTQTLQLRRILFKNEMLCLRYFVKIRATGQFRELGSAQCTRSPY